MRWHAESIWETLVPLLPGFTVEVLPEIDSTNTELMRRARAGERDPVLLVAERQTAGRGRLGRDWHSAVGDSLTFSLGLPLAPADWAGLSLAVGVAVAESLHEKVKLKWPNDLWLTGDQKLGGILIETASFNGPAAVASARPGERYAVIGIGLNIAAQFSAGDAAALRTPPAALQQLLPEIDAPAALARVARPLVHAVLAFQGLGFAPFQARFNARDVLMDRPVTLSDGSTGTARGVGGNGALLVHTADAMQHVTSAEVSVRPTVSATLSGATPRAGG
jgi:BirA family biotin operon repressor/biotin-[acetyl-CoA-carboxylase] ligase